MGIFTPNMDLLYRYREEYLAHSAKINSWKQKNLIIPGLETGDVF